MQQVNIRYVDSSVLGTCPAAVDMQTGVVSINKSVWHCYDQFEKNFILFHEIGHYELDTDSEYEADAYALKHVYRTAPRSLKRSLQTLCKIRVVDATRLERLYKEALKLDSRDGNAVAAVELVNIEKSNINQNFNGKMTPKQANTSYIKSPAPRKGRKVTAVRYATGEDQKSHKTNGIHIAGLYFSFTNILLMVLIAVVLFKK